MKPTVTITAIAIICGILIFCGPVFLIYLHNRTNIIPTIILPLLLILIPTLVAALGLTAIRTIVNQNK